MSKTNEEIFLQIRDYVGGGVSCPQCSMIATRCDDLEIVDGFVYCLLCGYLIHRGD